MLSLSLASLHAAFMLFLPQAADFGPTADVWTIYVRGIMIQTIIIKNKREWCIAKFRPCTTNLVVSWTGSLYIETEKRPKQMLLRLPNRDAARQFEPNRQPLDVLFRKRDAAPRRKLLVDVLEHVVSVLGVSGLRQIPSQQQPQRSRLTRSSPQWSGSSWGPRPCTSACPC